MQILPHTPRLRTTWREKSHFNDILEEVFAQTYQKEQCGFGMDLVVILEKWIKLQANAKLLFCPPGRTVENEICLFFRCCGLTRCDLIGGQHMVELEIINCVIKLKLTKHKCHF